MYYINKLHFLYTIYSLKQMLLLHSPKILYFKNMSFISLISSILTLILYFSDNFDFMYCSKSLQDIPCSKFISYISISYIIRIILHSISLRSIFDNLTIEKNKYKTYFIGSSISNNVLHKYVSIIHVIHFLKENKYVFLGFK